MARTIKTIIFILLALGGIWVRTVWLDEIPAHLSNDEISIAYDAYSIARTGAEEHGTSWPVSFQSHGTYKAPLYAYLLAPLTLFLPNNNLTPRLISVLAGILTCLVVGVLASQIFENKRIGYGTFLVLLWTPWHIFTSRMIYESNLALLFTSVFLLSQIKFRQSGKWYWMFLEITSGVLAMYSYHTQWVLIPILFTVELILVNLNIKKKFVILLFFAILILPLVQDYKHNLGTGARANSEVIWNEGKTVVELKKANLVVKAKTITGIFISNYSEYVNPGNLFFEGLYLLQKNSFYEMPLFWSGLLVAYIVGAKRLIRDRKQFKYSTWLWWIWLACPVVPALTHGGVNSLRNLPAIVPIILICVYGFYTLKYKLKIVVLVFSLIQALLFLGIYFVYTPINRASSYQSYRDLIPYIQDNYEKYDQIVVDSKFGDDALMYGVPHLYLAYYTTLNPVALQKRSNDPLGGMKFDKYTVTELNWSERPLTRNVLYIAANANKPNLEIEKSLELLMTFKDKSDRPSFQAWRLK